MRCRMPFAQAVVIAACVGASLTLLAPVADATRSQTPTRDHLIRLYHLEPYISYFTALEYGSSKSRVSASYVRALILSESAGDKFAHSTMGARGLTQILPSTGRRVSSSIAGDGFDFRYIDERKLDNLHPDMLYDPAINILIACYLNAVYSARWEGRIELMAAAWNAGPDAVASHGNRLPPYRETQTFVRRVLGYMAYFDQEGAG